MFVYKKLAYRNFVISGIILLLGISSFFLSIPFYIPLAICIIPIYYLYNGVVNYNKYRVLRIKTDKYRIESKTVQGVITGFYPTNLIPDSYIIYVACRIDGKTYQFNSEPILGSDYNVVGKSVIVFVNSSNYYNNVIDCSKDVVEKERISEI